MLPSTSARQDRRDRMLMLIKQHDHGEGWHKTGLAAVKPAFTNNWPVQLINVGDLGTLEI
jgi:hypothetical protein